MLEKARKRSYEHLHVLDLEQYPYNNQQFPESNYDALVCVGVMDFIKDPLQFLTYIRRFMKPHLKPQDSSGGGSSANEALPQSVIGLTLPERHPHSDLSSFSRSEMEELLRRCGFFVERHERILGYRDSKTNQVQYYHGWLCTLASPSSE